MLYKIYSTQYVHAIVILLNTFYSVFAQFFTPILKIVNKTGYLDFADKVLGGGEGGAKLSCS